nr:hypothetical protein [Leptospira interrogans]
MGNSCSALYGSRWKLNKTLSTDRVLGCEALCTIKFASDSPKYSYVEFTLILETISYNVYIFDVFYML